jgi:hypothetical protein
MPRSFRSRLAAAATAVLLAACTDDPFDRPGTVAPRGYNDANLRAMLVDPSHLRRGLESTTTRGDAAAKPVDLLRSGKRAPLAGNFTAAPSIDATPGGGNGGR